MKFYYFLLLSAFGLLLGSCGSVDNSQSAKPAGDISGFVNLYDVNGKPLVDNSGITVTIGNTNKTTTTNDSGRWIFNKLEAGTYTFTISKPGYGYTKIMGFPLVGGDMTFSDPQVLAATPTKVVDLKFLNLFYPAMSDSSTETSVSWQDSNYLDNEYGILCVSTDSVHLASDPLNAPYVHTDRTTHLSDLYHYYFYLPLNSINLKSLNLPSGTKFYATLCILGGGNYFQGIISSYFDLSTNRRIYTAPGPRSNIVSAVIP